MKHFHVGSDCLSSEAGALVELHGRFVSSRVPSCPTFVAQRDPVYRKTFAASNFLSDSFNPIRYSISKTATRGRDAGLQSADRTLLLLQSVQYAQ